MYINVDKLKAEVENYNKQINEYEKSLINLYNEFTQTEAYWVDPHAEKFHMNIIDEKKEINIFLNNLKEINNLYSFIVEQYSFGKSIQHENKNKESIKQSFDKIITELDGIIKQYEGININSKIPEKTEIDKKMLELINIKKTTADLKDKINDAFEKVEDIETNMRKKIMNIQIQNIKENDINEYI